MIIIATDLLTSEINQSQELYLWCPHILFCFWILVKLTILEMEHLKLMSLQLKLENF